MCSPNNSLLPYGIKLPTPMVFPPYAGMSSASAFDLHRAHAQLYDYNRLRLGLPFAPHPGMSPYHPGHPDPLAFVYGKPDPRTRFMHEEPKPSHSYIGLIGMGILSHKDKKMVLSDIYQHILDNYAYFRTRGPGWRNSIRHNLSLNDCFIKAGRSANGKGHYWAVHPANVDDFTKGDFRRRRAQRKVRKAMGLAVPDDEDSPSPTPGPAPVAAEWKARVLGAGVEGEEEGGSGVLPGSRKRPSDGSPGDQAPPKRRLFDVESLLAPDTPHPRVLSPPHPRVLSPPHHAPAAAGHPTSPSPQPGYPDSDQESLVDVDSPLGDEDHLQVDVTDHTDDDVASLTPRSVASPPTSPLSPHSFAEARGPLPSLSPPLCPPTPALSTPGAPRSALPQPGHEDRPGPHLIPAADHWKLPVGVSPWHERPSAFHNTMPATVTAWSQLTPRSCPLPMPAPHPGMLMPPNTPLSMPLPPGSLENAQKWQEAFSRILASTAAKNFKMHA